MKKILKFGVATILGALLFVGCTSAVVYNVEKDQIETSASTDKIYKAIRRAGQSKGWQVSQVKPGLAQAKINLRNHMALVEIPYSSDDFSIVYKDSMNLNYDSEKGTIHKNYNGWVKNLENQIRFEISVLND